MTQRSALPRTVTIVDLAPFFITLALLIPAELPDKTFIATLVLATRFPPLWVWLGVSAAFAVQTTIAVVAGGLLALLPETPVQLATAALFAVGAVVMFRGAGGVDPEAERLEEEELVDAAVGRGRGHARAFTVSFLVLFAAEWGDLSQLTTATLTARFDAPLAVWLGAWLALSLVAGAAAVGGRWLVARVSFTWVRRVSGSLLALLAIATLAEAVGLWSGL
jgi:putative Ca2+/H+ antiporter (TMEM165/GDT1 family)